MAVEGEVVDMAITMAAGLVAMAMAMEMGECLLIHIICILLQIWEDTRSACFGGSSPTLSSLWITPRLLLLLNSANICAITVTATQMAVATAAATLMEVRAAAATEAVVMVAAVVEIACPTLVAVSNNKTGVINYAEHSGFD